LTDNGNGRFVPPRAITVTCCRLTRAGGAIIAARANWNKSGMSKCYAAGTIPVSRVPRNPLNPKMFLQTPWQGRRQFPLTPILSHVIP
jgi:hypothetical protein